MKSLEELALQRGRLIERTRAQRAAVLQALGPLLAAEESVRRVAPAAALAAAATAALLVLRRPRRLLGLAKFGFSAWQAWRWASGLSRAAR